MSNQKKIPINRVNTKGVIYKTINQINDKIYIGQDSKNNPKYLGSGDLLKRAINKYGKDNFIKEVVCYCETQDELDTKEIYYISECSKNTKISISYISTCIKNNKICKNNIFSYEQ